MAENFNLTEEMKAYIGWESKPWTFLFERTGLQNFARGVGYTDSVYFDENEAKTAGYSNIPAPPTCLGTPVWFPGKNDYYTSGPANSVPNLDTGLKNVMDGGTEIEIFEDICAGDVLTAVNKLESLDIKESKRLGSMLIETYKRSYSNSDGKLMMTYTLKVIRY